MLQLWPAGAAHAIWLFATSWYVNLQEPFRRTAGGVDTADQLLDLVRTKDGEWRWKDEDELAAASCRATSRKTSRARFARRPSA